MRFLIPGHNYESRRAVHLRGWAGAFKHRICDTARSRLLIGLNQRESNPSGRERAFLLAGTERGLAGKHAAGFWRET